MEDRHRDFIKKCFDRLVKEVNIDELLPKLLDKKVYSEWLIKPFLDKNQNEINRKRALFESLPRRGPKAYGHLLDSLRDIDEKHRNLADLLEGVDSPEAPEAPEAPERPERPERPEQLGTVMYRVPNFENGDCIKSSLKIPYVDSINLVSEPLVVKVEMSTKFYDEKKLNKLPVYSMRSKLRGILLTINNINFLNNGKEIRNGAEKDDENLCILFSQMGFHSVNLRDQTKYDMRKAILDFVDEEKNKHLKDADCAVVIIMSHGSCGISNKDSYIYTQDMQRLETEWVEERFSNRNCPSLRGKPKILMFQICRGEETSMPDLIISRTDSDSFQGTAIREMCDMLIAYSTLPGRKSHRDLHTGTWYVYLICKVFMNHAHNTDIEGLLKLVDNEMSRYMSEKGSMQTSMYENRGFKLCYLNPGLYELEGKLMHLHELTS